MYLQGFHGDFSQESQSEPDESEDMEDITSLSRSYVDMCSGFSHVSCDSNSSDGDFHSDESLSVLTKKFLCKIRGQNRLTGKAVQNIAIAAGHLMHQRLSNIKRNIGEVLHNADVGSEEDFRNIERVFNEAAQNVEILRTPLSETFSNGTNNYCGLDKIVSDVPYT